MGKNLLLKVINCCLKTTIRQVLTIETSALKDKNSVQDLIISWRLRTWAYGAIAVLQGRRKADIPLSSAGEFEAVCRNHNWEDGEGLICSISSVPCSNSIESDPGYSGKTVPIEVGIKLSKFFIWYEIMVALEDILSINKWENYKVKKIKLHWKWWAKVAWHKPDKHLFEACFLSTNWV